MEAIGPPTDSGCWPWIGIISNSDGYGKFTVGSKADGTHGMRQAHRVVYELLVGPIPAGLDLDHECHNRDVACPGGNDCPHRRCVNPAHLVPRTRRANLLAGRGPAAVKAAQTHCIHGHLFDEANTYIAANGTRKCRACMRERSRRRYHDRKTAA